MKKTLPAATFILMLLFSAIAVTLLVNLAKGNMKFSSTQMLDANTEESIALEMTLAFVENVVGLDMTKYNATLELHMIDYKEQLRELFGTTNSGLFIYPIEVVNYELEAEGSKIKVRALFKDGAVYSLLVNPYEGLPVYSQPPPTNSLESAKKVLDEYQILIDLPYLQKMRSMLDGIAEAKTLIKTVDDVTLEIDGSSSFCWMFTVYGIDVRKKSVRIEFENGVFYSFHDKWNIYEIGDTEINVSRDEAVQMVRERAETFSWKVSGPNGTWIEVTEFALLEEPWRVAFSMVPRDSLVLYPYWEIWLSFDEIIYSSDGIVAGLWADTGDFESFDVTGFGGTKPEEILPEQSELTHRTNMDASTLIIAVFGATMAVVSVGLLIYFRRRKR